MKKIIFIFLLALLFSGCSFQTPPQEISTEQTEEVLLKELPTDDFNRNMTCLEQKESIKAELDNWVSEPSIESLFYSPQEKECVVLLNIASWGPNYSQKSLYRLSELTRSAHPIEGCMEEGYGACNKFAEEIIKKHKK